MVELLKQAQYRPYSVEDQVLSIYAGASGYLDSLPVSQVLEFELKVSLPGRLVGSLPITNISPAFNARIRAATEQEEQVGQPEELPALGQLYKEGDPLAVAVVACDRTEKGRWKVTLSLAPSRVLGPRDYATGDLVSAAVASREDHGFITDLSSNTLRGFVTSKAMAKANPAPTVGAVVWGVVTRVGWGDQSGVS